jgi:uncharacterized HAD superfamily protein
MKFMKKLIITVDYDDVIVPTAELTLRHYNEVYGTKLELKDFYSNDLSAWNVPDEATAIARVESYAMTDEFQHAEPLVDAVEVIRRLSKYHELHIVTGRADFLTRATTSMLAKHFPDIFQSIEFTNFFCEKARPKAEVCRSLHADVLIEDNLHHAATVAECGIAVLLFGDYPWNESEQLPANIQRVRGWREVARTLLEGEEAVVV